MTNAELKELVHLLMMCGIMDKTALESGNVTNEDWLRMKSLIAQYQAEKTDSEVPGDLISREALKKVITANHYLLSARNNSIDYGMFTTGILQAIDNAPTVEQKWRFYYDHGYKQAERALKRPQGEWYYNCQNGWHCSICHEIVKDMPTVMGTANFDYCPNCGADMRGGAK